MPGPYLNSGIFQTKVTANDNTQKEELGVLRFEGGKIYRYVKASSVIPIGEIVTADATVTTAALISYQVNQLSSVTNINVVGLAETTLAALNFGWITVYGPATGRVTTNTNPGTPLGAPAMGGQSVTTGV